MIRKYNFINPLHFLTCEFKLYDGCTMCRFKWMDDFVRYVRGKKRKKGKKVKSGTSKSPERTWHPLACT